MYIPEKTKKLTAAFAALSVLALNGTVSSAETGSITDFIDEVIYSAGRGYDEDYNFNTSYTPEEGRDMVDDFIDNISNGED